MNPVIENFLSTEDQRNYTSHKVFERFLRRAFGNDLQVMVGHHIAFFKGDEIPNEIPSADTLLFNPTLMELVFKADAPAVMLMLVRRPPEVREKALTDWLDRLDAQDRENAPLGAVQTP